MVMVRVTFLVFRSQNDKSMAKQIDGLSAQRRSSVTTGEGFRYLSHVGRVMVCPKAFKWWAILGYLAGL